MSEKNYIIAGGGLAGLFSAKTLLEHGCTNITIIEKSSETGGLLQHATIKNPLNDGRDFYFDHGTHFILEPDHPEIQKAVRKDIDPSSYYTFTGSLQEGHALNGRLYENSGCPDITALSEDKQKAIMNELLSLHEGKNPATDPTNLYEDCLNRYGATATASIYAPAYKKFTGADLKDLDISMGNFFAPGRLIIHDRQKSIELKKNSDWDWRIAFADCNDGTSNITKYYPKTGGIGNWLTTMAQNLTDNGVRILTNTTIAKITEKKSEIDTVTLSSGETLPCKQLIWSLPAIFLAMQTGTDVPSEKPVMRQVSLAHFIIDKKPTDRPFWITVYDSKLLSYRTTLYDNFAPSYANAARISVEILHSGKTENTISLEDDIFQELKKLNIIPSNTQKLWSGSTTKPEGFPILTTTGKKIYIEQQNILENKYDNLTIVGRRADTGGGQLSIMNHIWNTLKR